MDDTENTMATRYIEPKISLTWLISSTVSVAVALVYLGITVQTQTGQVSALTDKVQELRARLETRDARLDTLTQWYWELRTSDNIQTQQLATLTKQLEKINVKIGP